MDPIPVYARAQDLGHLLELKKAGATDAILENAETSLQLGSKLLKGLGAMSDDVSFLSQLVRESMELQAQEALERNDTREYEVLKPLQVRVYDMVDKRSVNLPNTRDGGNEMLNRSEVNHVPELRDGRSGDHNGDAGGDTSTSSSEYELEKGVKWCELDSDLGLIEDTHVENEKDEVDCTIPCITPADGLVTDSSLTAGDVQNMQMKMFFASSVS
ncbi:K(+) efflux antiporter 3 [Nymphaea thermarum]|nr:K(+) efflux antiporter 3 [Nymphaea thermarum]